MSRASTYRSQGDQTALLDAECVAYVLGHKQFDGRMPRPKVFWHILDEKVVAPPKVYLGLSRRVLASGAAKVLTRESPLARVAGLLRDDIDGH